MSGVAAANVQILELRTFLDFPYRAGGPVAASAALRDLAQGKTDRLPQYGLIGGHETVRVRRR